MPPFGNPPGLRPRKVLTVILKPERVKLQIREKRSTESSEGQEPLRRKRWSPPSSPAQGRGGPRSPRFESPALRPHWPRRPRTRPALPAPGERRCTPTEPTGWEAASAALQSPCLFSNHTAVTDFIRGNRYLLLTFFKKVN